MMTSGSQMIILDEKLLSGNEDQTLFYFNGNKNVIFGGNDVQPVA